MMVSQSHVGCLLVLHMDCLHSEGGSVHSHWTGLRLLLLFPHHRGSLASAGVEEGLMLGLRIRVKRHSISLDMFDHKHLTWEQHPGQERRVRVWRADDKHERGGNRVHYQTGFCRTHTPARGDILLLSCISWAGRPGGGTSRREPAGHWLFKSCQSVN